MDLLAIIKDRIGQNLTTTVGCVDRGTGHEPADAHDASEIEAIDVLIESASCTSGHDADDAFSEPVLTLARNSPQNTYVIPKNNLGGSLAARLQMRPASDISAEWPPDVQSLVDWFLILTPPTESFYLEPHIRIDDPAKYFQSLRREIETGPRGPRARLGTLQSDLRNLKACLN